MNRQQLKTLRPDIPTIIDDAPTNAAEQFQNECLRPVLKFQHELLLAIFRRYLEKRKNKYYELPATRRPTYIEHSIRQDRQFKNLLIGTVIGHFTLEEYDRYLEEEKELRRRLTDLLVQRVQDGMLGEGG